MAAFKPGDHVLIDTHVWTVLSWPDNDEGAFNVVRSDKGAETRMTLWVNSVYPDAISLITEAVEGEDLIVASDPVPDALLPEANVETPEDSVPAPVDPLAATAPEDPAPEAGA